MSWRLAFLVVSGSLLLLSATTPAPPPQQTGQVIDSTGPLPGVRVRYQGDGTFCPTDERGKFSLPPGNQESKRLTAWKDGYAIGSILSQNGSLKLQMLPLPKTDNLEYEWADPAPSAKLTNNCGNCHQKIYDEWKESSHARAATNRHMLNLFAGTDWHGQPAPGWNVLKENPLGAGVCATCHAPTFRDPMIEYDLRKVAGVTRHGVHCDYCHKIAGASVDERGLTFGKDGYELLRPEKDRQLSFGPLEDAFRDGELFAYSPLYKDSRYCASCHEGVVFGVHVYGTYSEWLQSPAKKKGQQCQTCHMTPTGTMTNIAPGHGGIEREPLTLASHALPGREPEMLKRCLKLAVETAPAKDGVRVRVHITAAHVGHRVPTGFLDRNLILVVEAADKKGDKLALLSGSRLSSLAGKDLTGKAGWIYAKQLHGPNGETPVPFWAPHGELADTRLVPEATDTRDFVFAGATGQVRVRLIYRRFWQDIADQKQWPDNETVVVDRLVPIR